MLDIKQIYSFEWKFLGVILLISGISTQTPTGGINEAFAQDNGDWPIPTISGSTGRPIGTITDFTCGNICGNTGDVTQREKFL